MMIAEASAGFEGVPYLVRAVDPDHAGVLAANQGIYLARGGCPWTVT